jgi:hypothetical protein
MIGCTVDGGISPVVIGTRGINIVPNRTAIGVVELSLDLPMAPDEYSAQATISEPMSMSDSTAVLTKTLVNGIAKITVKTFAGGVAADLDFDVTAMRYTQG